MGDGLTLATAPLYDHHFFKPDNQSRPVFIVGMGRSGTTMLRLMLNRSPDLAVLSETWFATRVWERRWGFPQIDPVEPFRGRLLSSFVTLLASPERADFPLAWDEYTERVLSGPASLNRFLSVLGDMWAARDSKPRWGEKTPVHVFHMRLLHAMYPLASFVHIVRDPRDVIASQLSAGFNVTDDPVALALEWGRTIKAADDDAEWARDRLIQIRYEDLIDRPDVVLADLCARLDIAYTPQMIEFHRDAVAYAPNQNWMGGLHAPLNRRSRQRWRRDLPRDELQLLEAVLHGAMDRWQYERESPHKPLDPLMDVVARLSRAFGAAEAARDAPYHNYIRMQLGSYRDLIETL